MLTRAISGISFLFIVLKIPVPKIGPISHPTPPQPKVSKPSVMNGSSGTWPTIASISDIASACAPPNMPPTLVNTDVPTCRRRRVLRSLKKPSQSSCGLRADEDSFVEAALLVAAVDAALTAVKLGTALQVDGAWRGIRRRVAGESRGCRSRGVEVVW